MATDIGGIICWAWWYDNNPSDHRCDKTENHQGPHQCCCGATIATIPEKDPDGMPYGWARLHEELGEET